MDETTPTFGTLLTDALANQGWSMREFARVAKLSPSYVSRLCGDTARPSLVNLDCWMDLLRIPSTQRPTWGMAALRAYGCISCDVRCH